MFRPSSISLIAAYFWNGEGYSSEARGWYEDAVIVAGVPTTELFSLYTPGSFSHHYILAAVSGDLPASSGTAEAAAICSIDSCALTASANLTIYLTDSLSLNVTYAGLFSPASGHVNEVDLSPVKHALIVGAEYLF